MKIHHFAACALVGAALGLATPAAAAAAAPAAQSYAEATRKLTAQPGLFDVWQDNADGRVLLGVRMLDQPFLLLTSLPFGLGSNDVELDRGQPGASVVVHFERHGQRLFLVEENARFTASSANADERAAVREAFATSVLWAGDIIATDAAQRYLVDFSSFLLADWHGVAARLSSAKQGSYHVDPQRSAVLAEQARSFPDNTELEAELTFSGAGEGESVRAVAPDPSSLTLRQHVSLVRLPGPGFRPRPYHPASGGIDTGYLDFGVPLARGMDVRWQLRHRLEKTDPAAAVSTVKKPIVYYLDRGVPEPVRSALLDGARWWASAFEKAGFHDAYRVELLPEGVDPMDARYNVILWTHRSTRGWSYGTPIADPRTGEIIRGVVNLGSQRVRQDILIAETLLAPYGKANGHPERAEAMALARLRQLAAHEVGHTLGFNHNFAASRHGNGSVMDYPHPLLRLDAAGHVALDEAYGNGVGPWDDFLVAHAYSTFAPEDEAAGLARLRAAARAQGLAYVTDGDARSPGAMHPDGLLWDSGADTLAAYDRMVAVRAAALRDFSPAVLPPDRQAGELAARLVPVYLLHRYQVEAVARLLGGASYASATGAELQAGVGGPGAAVVPVAAGQQKQALARLVASLQAEQLALPAGVLDLVPPAAAGYGRDREYFASRMDVAFDPLATVEAGAAQSVQFLFDPARLNRLAWQHARDPAQPGVTETVRAVFDGTWKRSGNAAVPGASAVQGAANWVVLFAALRTLAQDELHPGVHAQLRQQVVDLGAWLGARRPDDPATADRHAAAALIKRFLDDPKRVTLPPLPPIPPGAPI